MTLQKLYLPYVLTAFFKFQQTSPFTLSQSFKEKALQAQPVRQPIKKQVAVRLQREEKRVNVDMSFSMSAVTLNVFVCMGWCVWGKGGVQC